MGIAGAQDEPNSGTKPQTVDDVISKILKETPDTTRGRAQSDGPRPPRLRQSADHHECAHWRASRPHALCGGIIRPRRYADFYAERSQPCRHRYAGRAMASRWPAKALGQWRGQKLSLWFVPARQFALRDRPQPARHHQRCARAAAGEWLWLSRRHRSFSHHPSEIRQDGRLACRCQGQGQCCRTRGRGAAAPDGASASVVDEKDHHHRSRPWWAQLRHRRRRWNAGERCRAGRRATRAQSATGPRLYRPHDPRYRHIHSFARTREYRAFVARRPFHFRPCRFKPRPQRRRSVGLHFVRKGLGQGSRRLGSQGKPVRHHRGRGPVGGQFGARPRRGINSPLLPRGADRAHGGSRGCPRACCGSNRR